jgi:hypothetical protein
LVVCVRIDSFFFALKNIMYYLFLNEIKYFSISKAEKGFKVLHVNFVWIYETC